MDKTTIKRKAIEATKEYLVMVAYLWVILGLFGFTELQRVFGAARLRELFFRSRELEQAVSGEAAKET